MALALATCAAVPAATGIAALEDDDYCSSNDVSGKVYTEVSDLDQESSLLPPGLRCVYTQPDRTVTVAEVGGWGGFIPVLAVQLLVIGLVAWRSPTVPVHLRLFGAATLAIGVAGLGALVGAAQFAAVVGLFLGLPLACVVALALARTAGDRLTFIEFVVAGLIAGLAVALLLFWWLFGLGPTAAYGVALVFVAPLAYLAGRLLSHSAAR